MNKIFYTENISLMLQSEHCADANFFPVRSQFKPPFILYAVHGQILCTDIAKGLSDDFLQVIDEYGGVII